MAEWRDQTRIPKGMSDFARWFRPGLKNSRIMPTDLDAVLHTRHGNRFLMMEFKPAMTQVTTGQRILLDGFGQLPGCTALAIYDPFSQSTDRVQYEDELILKVTLFKSGGTADTKLTVSELNNQIKKWFDNTGLFV